MSKTEEQYRFTEERVNFLEDEAQRLRSIVDENEQEITRLNTYICEHKKLRIVYKDFIRALDNSITARLKERAKKKVHYPNIKKDKKLHDPEEIYNIINKSDKEAFLYRPNYIKRFSEALFTSLLWTHKQVKRLLKKAFRFIKQIRNSLQKGNNEI